VVVHADEADLNAFDLAGEGAALVESDRRVRGNLVAISKWAQGRTAEPAPSGHARRLIVRFWLRPVEILGTERVSGITLERTAIAADGALGGTGEFETVSAQMVLRSVGYQSVPLPGVPFDPRASVVPNALGRVLGDDGLPLPGEYVAGWLKRGPTGVIGTNKSDAAETIRCLLEDLAGLRVGTGEGDVQLPRAGLLRYPDRTAPAVAEWPLAGVLAGRGIKPVSYDEWLRIETAEADLAHALGRGERVKLHSAEAIWSACRPAED
jgi:NADPH-dependent glutamate synthase beta subunit-like oxidoreductase